MITEKNSVLKLIAGAPEDGLKAQIVCERDITSASYEISDKDGCILARGTMSVSGNEAACTSVFEAKYWSLTDPVLYTFGCTVEFSDGGREEVADRFGFRTLSADKDYLYLNGFPFYMRAYIRGCAAHEHKNNCRLSEYEFYKKNILMAKSYGFNAIRFHSVIPPRECFKAADELGILIHIETRPEKEEYENITEMLYGKNNFVSDEDLIETINSLYNHPSFMVYCVGNELRNPGTKPRVREIGELIKRLDPTRLFLDTCGDGEYDRDYVDFDVQHMSYFYPYGRHADMFANTDMLLCVNPLDGRDMEIKNETSVIKRKIFFERPLIAHEVCHYTAWRDFYALREKFKRYGTEAPWWVEEGIKMIERKGYKDNFRETLQVTKNFQMRCWKTALEQIRQSTLLSGFHMLQFADTDKYENSNGVVDCFDDPHGISAEEFKKFNGDTVILTALPDRIFSSGEDIRVPVILSCYAIDPPKRGDFSFSISDGECELVGGSMLGIDTGRSGIYEICTLEFKAPEVKSAKMMNLKCTLILNDGTPIDNNWDIWVFPREADKKITAQLNMREDYLDGAVKVDTGADMIITDKLDGDMFAALDAGRSVMLIYRTDWTRHLLHKGMDAPEYSFRALWERYKGVIWDRGTINGGTDDKELLTRHGFPAYGEIDYHYYPLIDDSDKINLDDFPFDAHSIVSGLDKSSRDRFDVTKFGFRELTYDRIMRHFSYSFMMNVGKGKLLVTGFNLTSVADGDPAACAMLRALASILAEGDQSLAVTGTDELKRYLSDIARSGPQKEGMMTQYWQLDDEPVESMEYWEESERYLREKT